MSTQKLNLDFILFSLALMYLIQIGMITSFLQSVCFLFYYKKSALITLFGFSLFLTSSFLFLRSVGFQSEFFNFLFISNCLSYCEKIQNSLMNLSQKKPLVFFLLIHTYFCTLLLHIFFYFNGIQELPVEYLYNLFNLVRVAVFPRILLVFVLNYSPVSPEILESTVPHIKKILSNLLSLLAEQSNYKKNPKKAFGLYGVTLATGAVVYNKKNIQDNVNDATETLGLDFKPPPAFISGTGNTREDNIAAKTFSLLSELKLSSPLLLTFNDLKALLKNEPSLRDQLQKALSDYKFEESQYLARQTKLKESADQGSISPLARRSTSANEETPQIPSIIEDFFFI